ncbi:hypothetical protein JQ620_15755 [Bradyrhizobium sp. AUGA SZCCT0274]|uniref:hypothetical protein n=1 Tax=Bradyrhizobium sp. AUGA SZCCT0274 TaxID=2807670 RepID=UPI001BACF482|nr:hypothetical protein [Bradyrhizobium sp. AUGA SZCCT0274]MBR1241584.1 hypothetical protein [Bradyrhizobium sp. AUGA SZCCT0274]
MPVKKRTPKGRNFQITPEAVELFRKILEIISAGDDDVWEEDDPPGRRRKFQETEEALNRALGRTHPWEESITYALSDDPGWQMPPSRLEDYREAAALRRELVARVKRSCR